MKRISFDSLNMPAFSFLKVSLLQIHNGAYSINPTTFTYNNVHCFSIPYTLLVMFCQKSIVQYFTSLQDSSIESDRALVIPMHDFS